MNKFLDNFWDTDFNSTNGYDVLLKRMKDGREMCKAVEELLRGRARAEDQFGKSLQSLVKNAKGKEEIGGLRKSWDELLNQTDQMGMSHVQLGLRMLDEAKKIEEFRESQKEKRKKPEESTKRAQGCKKDWYQKVVQAKKTFENRKRELDIADENYMKQRLVLAPKELDKLIQKKDKSSSALEQADAQYNASVKSLDDARRDWEKQMEEICVVLQAMEEERIKFLRNTMWVHTNTLSLHCVQDDEHCEEIRGVLEQCTEENDIKLFVAQKRTGSSRPAPIEIECNRNNAKVVQASPNGRSTPSPTTDAHRRRDPHTALPSIPGNMPSPAVNGGRRSLPRQQENDPLYAAVESPPPQMNTGAKQNFAKAVHEYKAQGPSELSLILGQIVTVHSMEDPNWWVVGYEGRQGHVPRQFIELLHLNERSEGTFI